MTPDELRTVLSNLTRIEYELQRRDLSDRCGVRASGLDAIYSELHGKSSVSDGSPGSGGQVDTPWETLVDGQVLLEGMVSAIERFIVASRHAVYAMALWALHAHLHLLGLWSRSPILMFWGPMEECGKTVATSVESRLVPNALRGAGLSLAYVLRRAPGRTVCWDEIDKELRRKGQDIDGWLTRGYQRGWLFGRADPNDPYKTIEYDPWCPKAISLIGKPWDRQLLSRCIPIEMRRKLDEEKVEDFDDTESYPMFDDLRRMAARWAADHLEPLRKPRPERPDGLYRKGFFSVSRLNTSPIGIPQGHLVGLRVWSRVEIRRRAATPQCSSFSDAPNVHGETGRTSPTAPNLTPSVPPLWERGGDSADETVAVTFHSPAAYPHTAWRVVIDSLRAGTSWGWHPRY